MVFQSNARPSSACQVAGFHRAIGRRLPQRPALLDAAELVFRMTLLGEEMAKVQQAAAELGATLPGAEVTDVFPLAHELIDLLLRGLRRSAGAGRGSGNRLRRLLRRSASI